MKVKTSIGKQEGGTATGRSTEAVLAKQMRWLEEGVRGGAKTILLLTMIITTTD